MFAGNPFLAVEKVNSPSMFFVTMLAIPFGNLKLRAVPTRTSTIAKRFPVQIAVRHFYFPNAVSDVPNNIFVVSSAMLPICAASIADDGKAALTITDQLGKNNGLPL
jgi:hypothetical protein